MFHKKLIYKMLVEHNDLKSLELKAYKTCYLKLETYYTNVTFVPQINK